MIRTTAAASVIVSVIALGQLPPLPTELSKELPTKTRFAAEGAEAIPKAEHPRPLLVRTEHWQVLNGKWDFAFSREGPYTHSIRVPFAPESALSGLFRGQEIFEHVRYRRQFSIDPAWRKEGREIWIHFEAVDWQARVLVNGRSVGEHQGGYGRFGFPINSALHAEAEQVVEVIVYDPSEKNPAASAPRGKQRGSEGIWYTRTTGIWQTVWLESVPSRAISELHARGAANGDLELDMKCRGDIAGSRIIVKMAELPIDGSPPKFEEAKVWELPASATTNVRERVSDILPWSPTHPRLYALRAELQSAELQTLDIVSSYVAFRSVGFDPSGLWTLNGQPTFLVGVLDQGYWPESGMTAPSDAALRHDVDLTKSLGLNLSRKHTKVEEARFYYWCDRLGVLVMQDMPSPMTLPNDASRANYLAELAQMVDKVGGHPSIVHWVVFNEDWGHPEEFQDVAVQHVRTLDPTRQVTDASGWTQRQDTDFTDIHDYGHDFRRHARRLGERPKILGECGGIAFSDPAHRWSVGWGYTSASTPDAFVRRIARQGAHIHEIPGLSGFVWTQLTDVEQELNGLVHYDRSLKVPLPRLRRALLGEDRPLHPPLRALRWEVLGPIAIENAPTTARDDEAGRAAVLRILLEEQVPSEAALDERTAPAEHRMAHWRSVEPSESGVDLRALYGEACNGVVAYAVGYLDLAEPTTATLLFGSDDGARVWIDGKLVHSVARVRGVSLGDDEIGGIALPAGRVRIVVKVVQGMGGMGFALEFER